MAFAATTVFCDDIRTEQNGKFILVGTYGSDLVPSAMPGTFPLSLWIRLEGLSVGKSHFRLELQMPGGSRGVAVEGDGELRDASRPVVMTFNSLPCELNSYGDIVCQLSINNDEPVEIGRLKVSEPQVS